MGGMVVCVLASRARCLQCASIVDRPSPGTEFSHVSMLLRGVVFKTKRTARCVGIGFPKGTRSRD